MHISDVWCKCKIASGQRERICEGQKLLLTSNLAIETLERIESPFLTVQGIVDEYYKGGWGFPRWSTREAIENICFRWSHENPEAPVRFLADIFILTQSDPELAGLSDYTRRQIHGLAGGVISSINSKLVLGCLAHLAAYFIEKRRKLPQKRGAV